MLPALVDRLETVAVGIEYVRSVITRIVIEARARLTVVSRAGCHGCLVERVHLGLALGNKADMSSPRIRIALSKPEENATVPSKANCIAKTESIKPEERFVDRSKEQSAIYQLEPITTRLLLQLIDGPISVLIRHQWIFL